MSVPEHQLVFQDQHGSVTASGFRISDIESFRLYLHDRVRSRLEDSNQALTFDDDMRGLATTGMASDCLAELLAGPVNREGWHIGEALAECLLEDIEGAIWPWNLERDKRTPKASLPGADMIGFVRIDGRVLLLLGETKTSSDANSPPNVMNGRGGMVQQLDRLATEISIHRSLLNWLHARCKDTQYWPLYQEAATHYLHSGGKLLVLCGMLMRDTPPAQTDLSSRAMWLGTKVTPPTSANLQAWYLPSPIRDWPALAQGRS